MSCILRASEGGPDEGKKNIALEYERDKAYAGDPEGDRERVDAGSSGGVAGTVGATGESDSSMVADGGRGRSCASASRQSIEPYDLGDDASASFAFVWEETSGIWSHLGVGEGEL